MKRTIVVFSIVIAFSVSCTSTKTYTPPGLQGESGKLGVSEAVVQNWPQKPVEVDIGEYVKDILSRGGWVVIVRTHRQIGCVIGEMDASNPRKIRRFGCGENVLVCREGIIFRGDHEASAEVFIPFGNVTGIERRGTVVEVTLTKVLVRGSLLWAGPFKGRYSKLPEKVYFHSSIEEEMKTDPESLILLECCDAFANALSRLVEAHRNWIFQAKHQQSIGKGQQYSSQDESTVPSDKIEEIELLRKLKEEGVITEEEYKKKAREIVGYGNQ